jgi:hypothetical protein
MTKNSILFALVLFLAQLITVQAQDETIVKGTETGRFVQFAENERCIIFDRYIVKVTAGEDLGEDIEIHRRVQSINPDTICDSNPAPYYTIKNADANYFAGLSGDYLFVDNGTGTDGRGLEIFSLKSKKSIYSTEYYDAVEFNKADTSLRQTFKKPSGALKNCRQAAQWKKNGLGVGWIRQSKLDLQTLKETPIGMIRCRAFQ